MKLLRERSAENLQAAFEAEGIGNMKVQTALSMRQFSTLRVSSKGWQSQQETNLSGQKSEPGNLSNSVASDQNIEAY